MNPRGDPATWPNTPLPARGDVRVNCRPGWRPAPAGEQRGTLSGGGLRVISQDHAPEPAHRCSRTLSGPQGQPTKPAPGAGTEDGLSLPGKPTDPGPGPPAHLEEPVPELVGGQFEIGRGDAFAVEADRALRDLPGPFGVGLRQAGQGQETGHPDAPVHQVLGPQLELGDVVGDVVLLEHLVEGRLAARSGAVTVVEVDDRPGQEALG